MSLITGAAAAASPCEPLVANLRSTAAGVDQQGNGTHGGSVSGGSAPGGSAPGGSAKGGSTAEQVPSEKPSSLVGASDQEISDRLLALAGEDGGEEAKTADEKEHEEVEKLIEQMAFLRERGDTLSCEARRERAAQAATQLASMFGEDLGGDDDSD